MSATPDAGQGVLLRVDSSMGARILAAADGYIGLYDPISESWVGRLDWQ